MKKKLLIVAPRLETGGVTASLLSLLNHLREGPYQTDLLLTSYNNEHLSEVPPQVRVLKPPFLTPNPLASKLYLHCRYLLNGYLIKKYRYQKQRAGQYANGMYQLMSGLARCSAAKPQKASYDVAIGYMEGFPNVYVARKVRAPRKIAYIHPDYIKAGLDPVLDQNILTQFDRIALVSEDCKESFDTVFPQLSGKSVVVENLPSVSAIRRKAEEPIPEQFPQQGFFTIVTAARLRNLDKGLDRAVRVMSWLKEHGRHVKWYIFGEGGDRQVLEQMIRDHGLAGDLLLMGNRSNVYPYIKRADLFVMTSRYEGKPVAVTEAQILGVPVLATNYRSAKKQIGGSGMVVENNSEALLEGLLTLLDQPDLLSGFRSSLASKNFNAEEIRKTIQLLLEE